MAVIKKLKAVKKDQNHFTGGANNVNVIKIYSLRKINSIKGEFLI